MSDYKLVNYQIESTVESLASSEMTEGVGLISASELWAEGFKGQGEVIAIFDTGCFNHPDLAGRIIGGRNFTTDYNSDVNNYNDGNGHGTHVAGTICANSNGTGVVGVAPDTKVLILKILSNAGSGSWYWLINAIDYAIAWRGPNGEKVSVFSMSLGGSAAPIGLHDAIKRADAAGIVIVCAAGNEGDGSASTTEVSYPGYYPEVVCVGAFSGWGNVSSFSNSNDQVDLIALGNNVLSTYLNGEYAYLSGTSMATPHVSAALLLLKNKLEAVLERPVTGLELYKFLVNNHTHFIPAIDKLLQGNGLVVLGNTNTISTQEINFDDVLKWFTTNHPRQVLNSYDYWNQNAVLGKTCKGEYVQGFMKKTYIVHGLNMTVAE